jgi:hypothetical protein
MWICGCEQGFTCKVSSGNCANPKAPHHCIRSKPVPTLSPTLPPNPTPPPTVPTTPKGTSYLDLLKGLQTSYGTPAPVVKPTFAPTNSNAPTSTPTITPTAAPSYLPTAAPTKSFCPILKISGITHGDDGYKSMGGWYAYGNLNCEDVSCLLSGGQVQSKVIRALRELSPESFGVDHAWYARLPKKKGTHLQIGSYDTRAADDVPTKEIQYLFTLDGHWIIDTFPFQKPAGPLFQMTHTHSHSHPLTDAGYPWVPSIDATDGKWSEDGSYQIMGMSWSMLNRTKTLLRTQMQVKALLSHGSALQRASRRNGALTVALAAKQLAREQRMAKRAGINVKAAEGSNKPLRSIVRLVAACDTQVPTRSPTSSAPTTAPTSWNKSPSCACSGVGIDGKVRVHAPAPLHFAQLRACLQKHEPLSVLITPGHCNIQ